MLPTYSEARCEFQQICELLPTVLPTILQMANHPFSVGYHGQPWPERYGCRVSPETLIHTRLCQMIFQFVLHDGASQITHVRGSRWFYPATLAQIESQAP